MWSKLMILFVESVSHFTFYHRHTITNKKKSFVLIHNIKNGNTFTTHLKKITKLLIQTLKVLYTARCLHNYPVKHKIKILIIFTIPIPLVTLDLFREKKKIGKTRSTYSNLLCCGLNT